MTNTATAAMGLPAPLVPSDCDVRDLPGMMLEVSRLMQSKAWLKAARVPFLAFQLVNLWTRAFHEVPAGSIENDDDVLCDAAKCPPTEWEAAKAECLRGWVLCNDGRLYHPVVAEKALELWARKLDRHHAAAEGRVRKAWARKGKQGDAPAIHKLEWLRKEYPASYSMADRILPADELEGWDGQSLSSGQEQMSAGQTGLSQGQNGNGPDPSEGQPDLSGGNRSKREGKEREGKESYSVEDKSSTGAAGAVVVQFPQADNGKPDWWPSRDRFGRVTSEASDKVLYQVAKVVLGKESGGLITRLKRCAPYNHDYRAAIELLLRADDEKADPKAWFVAALKRAEIDEPLDPQHVKFPEADYRA